MDRQDPTASLSGHVVVCNCNANVGELVEDLQSAGLDESPVVVVVIQNRQLWAAHPEWHPRKIDRERYIEIAGSPAEERVLERASIRTARAAVVLADPCQGMLADARTTLVALAIEDMAPAVHTVVELLQPVNRVHLRHTDVDDVVCVSEVKEKLIAQSCVTPWVKEIFRHILATKHGENAQLVVQDLPAVLYGLSFRQLARRAILAQAPFVLVGFVRKTAGGPPQIVLSPPAEEDPGKDTALGAGDQLVVVARGMPDLEGPLAAEASGDAKAPKAKSDSSDAELTEPR